MTAKIDTCAGCYLAPASLLHELDVHTEDLSDFFLLPGYIREIPCFMHAVHSSLSKRCKFKIASLKNFCLPVLLTCFANGSR